MKYFRPSDAAPPAIIMYNARFGAEQLSFGLHHIPYCLGLTLLSVGSIY